MIFGAIPNKRLRIDTALKVVVQFGALRHVHEKRSQVERIGFGGVERASRVLLGIQTFCTRLGGAPACRSNTWTKQKTRLEHSRNTGTAWLSACARSPLG